MSIIFSLEATRFSLSGLVFLNRYFPEMVHLSEWYLRPNNKLSSAEAQMNMILLNFNSLALIL